MNSTTALYFDGKSSAPNSIEIGVDDRLDELHVNLPGQEGFVWRFAEIEIDHIGNSLEITHPKFQMEKIKITNKVFISTCFNHLDRKGHLSSYQKLVRAGMKIHLMIALFIMGAVVGGYIYVIPWVAERSVFLIPETFDDYLGNTFIADYFIENKIDEEKTAFLANFAAELELNNTNPLNFMVVNSSMVNAFALPDGTIILFTGLLQKMESYEELAGLIGHEVMHVNKRHSIKMMSRNLAGYLFLSAVFSDVNGIMAVIADNAHNLQSLSYSREFEREADEGGTLLMIKNNIDPNGMIQLFKRLQNEENSLTTLPEFLSSHPFTSERIRDIEQLIDETDFTAKKWSKLENFFRQLQQ